MLKIDPSADFTESAIDQLAELRWVGNIRELRNVVSRLSLIGPGSLIDEAAVEAWLPALTDLRLAFGTRIGVTEDIDAERAEVLEGSLRHAELAAYDWMSWLQDAIVRGLTGD